MTHQHRQFLDDGDLAQTAYERLRKAYLDRRVRCNETLLSSFHAHGIAGLFIDPERTLDGCQPPGNARISRRGTAFHHSHLPEQTFETIGCCLAEGVGVLATGRIHAVNNKTVLAVLKKAAQHVTAVQDALLFDQSVSECQLDELWSFVGKKEKNLDTVEKLSGDLGDAWIWIAFDAVSKVVLASVVGKRTVTNAVKLLQQVKRVTARTPALFSSDQFDPYRAALLTVYGVLVQPPRKPGPGRPPNPRLVPPEDLLYVQVVKEYKGNAITKVSRRLVFGDQQKLEQSLSNSTVSRKINTSYVERVNGTIRHIDARCNRKTYRFSKRMTNHQHQLNLSIGYYHLCRVHRTLSKTHGRPTTPFMAAGITDHVWTMAELLRSPTKKARA